MKILTPEDKLFSDHIIKMSDDPDCPDCVDKAYKNAPYGYFKRRALAEIADFCENHDIFSKRKAIKRMKRWLKLHERYTYVF